ncbi:hypothetical protein COU78_06000 [Candidatus Peregrinibacteria bacterium CG10_big_fil_rev_8_21_14_0_10_49_24]|nr:MAG: hypothetical protein COV83_05645 [Candidatus Peregrinibacteria bacterium CG11_big_fil_rev_8_21_14_0_20_49_14]PIR50530.1 MAG: hypothetical protein COU78_06000 [Candidatus Peregrinibacteria bacterium CG10_big_fil_rev_8_21_14_0_10_49_24]PJA67333.1 MAG: hypothetical protein CO157_05175 [Candidatus Peregrinibacteria bacterium CG_4_9_14_3_um_filter_49_12]
MHRHNADTSGRILREQRLLFATVGPRESGNAPAESEPLPQVESERRVGDLKEGATETELQNLRREVEQGSIPVISASQDIPNQQDLQTPSGASSDTPPSNKDAQSESSESAEKKDSFVKELIRFVFEFIQSVSEGRLSISDFTQKKGVQRAIQQLDQQVSQIEVALAGDGLTPDQIRVLQDRRTDLQEQRTQLDAQLKNMTSEEKQGSQQSQQPAESNPSGSEISERDLRSMILGGNKETVSNEQFIQVMSIFLEHGDPAQIRFFENYCRENIMQFARSLRPPASNSEVRNAVRELCALVNDYMDSHSTSSNRLIERNLSFAVEPRESS